MDFNMCVEWEPTQQAIHYTLYNNLKSCRSKDFITLTTHDNLVELICSATSETCEKILES